MASPGLVSEASRAREGEPRIAGGEAEKDEAPPAADAEGQPPPRREADAGCERTGVAASEREVSPLCKLLSDRLPERDVAELAEKRSGWECPSANWLGVDSASAGLSGTVPRRVAAIPAPRGRGARVGGDSPWAAALDDEAGTAPPRPAEAVAEEGGPAAGWAAAGGGSSVRRSEPPPCAALV